MLTMTRDDRGSEHGLPTIDLGDTKIDLPKLGRDLSKVELPKVDLDTTQLAKAVTDAAVAIGLMERRRSRWPFVLGAAVAAIAIGWIVMQREMIREWFQAARNDAPWSDDALDPVAFTAAETAPMQRTASDMSGGQSDDDYPDSLGATNASSKPANGKHVDDQVAKEPVTTPR